MSNNTKLHRSCLGFGGNSKHHRVIPAWTGNAGDVDLEAKLHEWERFYNLARPHGAHNGKTPYEALREKL